MAEADIFAGVAGRKTDASTGVDLTAKIGQAFLIVSTGLAVTGITLEEQLESGGAWTAIADADLLFSTSTAVETQGTPADSKIGADEFGVVRYRGVGVAIRGSGTNADTYVLLGCPNRNSNIDNQIAD